MTRVICLLLGYLFGCFQTSYFYGLKQGIDIRRHGSGNAGTTNALRVMGGKAGAIVFAGDLGKIILAVLSARLVLSGHLPEEKLLITLFTAVGCVMGHDFPFYMGFKGGKGIAVTSGLLILLDWRLALGGGILFFGVFFTLHYVSLGSVLMILWGLGGFILLGEKGLLAFGTMPRTEAYLLMASWAALAIYRHRDNIVRLFKGTESKVYLSKRSERR